MKNLRLLVIAAALFAAGPVEAAVVTLSSTWQSLGNSAPVLLQGFGCDAVFEDSGGSAPTDAGHVLYKNQTPFAYNTATAVWVKLRGVCTNNAGQALTGTLIYSPIVVGGGGGGGGGGGAITAPLGSNTKANSVSTTFATDFLGQATMAGSLPVVIASNQSTVPVVDSTLQTAVNSLTAQVALPSQVQGVDGGGTARTLGTDTRGAFIVPNAGAADTVITKCTLPATSGSATCNTYTGTGSAVTGTAVCPAATNLQSMEVRFSVPTFTVTQAATLGISLVGNILTTAVDGTGAQTPDNILPAQYTLYTLPVPSTPQINGWNPNSAIAVTTCIQKKRQ